MEKKVPLFADVRERKYKDSQKRSIGFFENGLNDYEHYNSITRKDIIEMGGAYELLGRFSYVVNFEKLSNRAINSIIEELIKKESTYLGVQIKMVSVMNSKLKGIALTI